MARSESGAIMLLRVARSQRPKQTTESYSLSIGPPAVRVDSRFGKLEDGNPHNESLVDRKKRGLAAFHLEAIAIRSCVLADGLRG